MFDIFIKKNEKKREFLTEAESAEKIEKEKIEAKEKKMKELEMLRQMDSEARQNLRGSFLEKYVLAKELRLEHQAEIARIEGITNTTYIDLAEQDWLLRKKMSCRMGYSVGGSHYNRPTLNTQHSSVEDFTGKIDRGALLRYKELKDAGIFEEIKIMHYDIGADPLMYGVRIWNQKKLYFLIMLWE